MTVLVKRLVLLFLLSLLLLVSAVSAVRKQHQVRGLVKYHSLIMCKEKKSAITSFNATFFKDPNGKEYVNADMVMSRGAKSSKKISVSIDRCKGYVSSNTCEYYQTWAWTLGGVCEVLQAKHVIWSPIVSSITPRFGCPMKKGLYQARNASMDVGAALRMGFPTDTNVWMTRMEAYDENDQLYGCLEAEFETARVT